MISIRLKTSVGKNLIKALSSRFYCSQADNPLDGSQPTSFNKFNAKSFPEFSVCDSGNPLSKISVRYPNPKVIINIALGKDLYERYPFSNKVNFHELHSGCLFATEVASNILAHEDDLENSDLPEIVTKECFDQIKELFANDPKFQSEESRAHLFMPQEDVFFSWVENITPDCEKLRLVTMSFPSYSYVIENLKILKQKRLEFVKEMKNLKEQQKSGQISMDPDEIRQKFDDHKESISKIEPLKHVRGNLVVCSNWDFVQVDNEWILQGIKMNILTSFFSRWKSRLLWHFYSRKPFINILRFDYITLYIMLFWALPIFIFGEIDGARRKKLEKENMESSMEIR